MGAIGRLLGFDTRPSYAVDPADCDHPNLMPRWRNHDALGDPSQAMGYVCHRCHGEFLPRQVADRVAASAPPAAAEESAEELTEAAEAEPAEQ